MHCRFRVLFALALFSLTLFANAQTLVDSSSHVLNIDSLYPDPEPMEMTAVTSQTLIAEPSALWDLGVLIEGGNGLEDRTSYHFLSAGAYLGRILTDDYTAMRANFEYGVELLPLWQSYTPAFQKLNCTAVNVCSAPTTTGGTYRGVSIVPIILRINMLHGGKFQPWLQGAGGLIYTTRKYPPVGNLDPTNLSENGPAADTSVWNFDPQFGIGAHYFLKPRRSLDISANAVHISSASLGDKNPGVNTGVQFSLGYSWWK